MATIFVRGVSSVGNIEPRAQELRVTTTQTGNTADQVIEIGPAGPVLRFEMRPELVARASTARFPAARRR